MEYPQDRILKIKEKVLIQDFENESIILNIETGKYFEINNISKKIISLIQQKDHTYKTLVAELKKEYDSKETEKDLSIFITQLLDLKILEAR